MRLRHLALAAMLLLAIAPAYSQKKPIGHEIYDSWRSLTFRQMTRDGKWAMYAYTPQQGDNVVEVKNLSTGQTYTFDRGQNFKFTHDGKYVVSIIVPKFDEVKKGKKEKKKADDMPKNGLLILNLETGQKTELERIMSYTMAEEGSDWIIYRPEKPKEEPEKPEEAKKLETPAAEQKPEAKPAEPKPEQKPEEPKKEEPKQPEKKSDHKVGDKWVLRNLKSGAETPLENISNFVWNKAGTVLAYSISAKDKLGKDDVVVWRDLSSGATETAMGPGLAQCKDLVISDAKDPVLAILTDKDDYQAKKPSHQIYLYNPKSDKLTLAAKEGTKGVPEGWWVNDDGQFEFSESGSRLLFTTQPKQAEEKEDDTLEEDKPKMDVWNWKDDRLQPMQLLAARREADQGYLAVYDVKSGDVTQLENKDLPNIGNKNDAPYALGTTDLPHRRLISWEGFYSDVYVVDVKTGKATKVREKATSSTSSSSTVEHLAWVDETGQLWTYETKSGKKTQIAMPTNLLDELNDVPDTANPYGFGGWTKDDKQLLVYDRYDVWSVDPSGKEKPVALTRGRPTKTVYRHVELDREAEFIDTTKPLLLAAQNEVNKQQGFASLVVGQSPRQLVMEDWKLGSVLKAEEADTILFSRERFDVYPDHYVTDLSFANPKKITDVNPQMKDYAWGTSELISWRSLDGEELQGILIKPANFDSTKKYPMISYFYERMSDELNDFWGPGPSYSSISPSMYASNGYVVFVPDIPYKEGYPGESAVSAIVPGVQEVVRRGFVDPSKIGIQGQSWGGYQVAYLVTETNMFAAACAGAPVSNMFSAYGGIRWGSGLVRAFQYERGQSRIGYSMWDRPLRYVENSPIFFADKVETPLLILSNDADGAVPWYQGIELFTALRRLNKPVWLVNYNGDDHNLTKYPNRVDWSIRMQQYFDHLLKGAPAPVWMEKGIPATEKGKNLGYDLVGAAGG
jgi:dipeptidyl aminopeptidase/acylaminoacyl peptidase/outer membrane biosynthesis protein TonB